MKTIAILLCKVHVLLIIIILSNSVTCTCTCSCSVETHTVRHTWVEHKCSYMYMNHTSTYSKSYIRLSFRKIAKGGQN